MLKIIQILLFFFFGYSVIGQSTITKELIEYLKSDKFSIDSVRSILGTSKYNYNNLEITTNLDDKILIETYIERKVDFGYFQFLLEYYDYTDFSEYEVAIQYNEKEPIIILFYRRGGIAENKALIRILSEEINVFLKKYNSKYQSNFKVKEIKDDFLKPYEFGYACSVSGTPTDKFSEMMRLAHFKKKAELKRWLISPNINLRLFGAIGLELLKYRGLKLSEREKEFILELKKENYLINYCSGCSISEMKTIQELMNEKDLKNFYKFYKKRGWFK